MQGGGTEIFAAVPLNMMNESGTADYLVTGKNNMYIMRFNLNLHNRNIQIHTRKFFFRFTECSVIILLIF